jgi:hypothetical protein
MTTDKKEVKRLPLTPIEVVPASVLHSIRVAYHASELTGLSRCQNA